jgi:hypothetical protein
MAGLPRKTALDLKPGQYFKDDHGYWWRADSEPHDGGNRVFISATSPRDGERHMISIYMPTVSVTMDGKTPSVFQPATLKRRADKMIAEAEELKKTAGALYQFALRTEQAAAHA